MNIGAKLGLSRKRELPKKNTCFPIQAEVRSRSLKGIFSYGDFLNDLITLSMIKQHVYHPHIPKLIVEFVPIYTWTNPYVQRGSSNEGQNIDDVMNVALSHCNTIASNSHQKFGAVLGSKLDPRLDHIINIKLLDGLEFGIGICDATQLSKKSRRDFMCVEGGYGYYNYKTKYTRLKPKYPPGLYYQVQSCRKVRGEADICKTGDVLTMVIQRENLKPPVGRSFSRSRFSNDRCLKYDPMDNLKESEKHTLSFYKNGEDMGLHLHNLVGPFYICLNYYFVESKVRLLSDYNFRKRHKQWLRRQHSRKVEQDSKVTMTITTSLFI